MQIKVAVLTILVAVIFTVAGYAMNAFAGGGFNNIGSTTTVADTAHIRLLNDMSYEFYLDDQNDSSLFYASIALSLSGALLSSEEVAKDLVYLNTCKILKANSYLNIAIALESLNDPIAIDTIQHALSLARETNNKVLLANVLSAIGMIYEFSGQSELALEYDMQSLELYRESGDQQSLAKELTNVAIVNRNIGNYGESMEYLMESLKISLDINDSSIMVESLLAMGFVYLLVEKWDEALDVQSQALEILEMQNDSFEIARVYNDMGVTNMTAGNLSEALKKHQAALAIRLEYMDDFYLSASYSYIGNVYEDMNMYPDALGNYIEALKYAKHSAYKFSIIDSHLCIGRTHLKMNNYGDAFAQFDTVLVLSREIDEGETEAKAFLNMAKIHQIEGDHGLALSRLKDAEAAASKSNLVFLDEIYQRIAETYFILGDFKKAYLNLENHRIVKDSIVVAKNVEKVSSLSSKLEFENKQAIQVEKHNQLIELKQAEINRQKLVRNFFLLGLAVLLILVVVFIIRYLEKNKLNTKLNRLLNDLKATQSQLIQSEKMASLGELTAGIAHEIQNPLNFVNNFSELSTELLEEMEEELASGDIEEAKLIGNDIKLNLEKINHHGKRADGIVKGMLQHSRSIGATLEATDINSLTDEYLRLAFHGMRAKEASFNSKIPTSYDETIGIVSVIPQDIGRVILNLINNAFYAVNEKMKQFGESYEPTVSITTKKIGVKFEIRVKDNGNGIPTQIKGKIFQPFFTTKPTGQGTGLGLSISYDIIKAHNGELEVETSMGQGTEFIISLPLNI